MYLGDACFKNHLRLLGPDAVFHERLNFVDLSGKATITTENKC